MPSSIVLTAGHSSADRTCRLLLILTVAGERGILVEELPARIGASRATMYRDVERIKRAGWRLDFSTDDDGRVTYALAAWQKVPRLDKKKRARR